MKEPYTEADNAHLANDAGDSKPDVLTVKSAPQQEHQSSVAPSHRSQTEDDGERLAREIGESLVVKLKEAKLGEVVLAITSVALVIIGASQAVVAWENYHDTSPDLTPANWTM